MSKYCFTIAYCKTIKKTNQRNIQKSSELHGIQKEHNICYDTISKITDQTTIFISKDLRLTVSVNIFVIVYVNI